MPVWWFLQSAFFRTRSIRQSRHGTIPNLTSTKILTSANSDASANLTSHTTVDFQRARSLIYLFQGPTEPTSRKKLCHCVKHGKILSRPCPYLPRAAGLKLLNNHIDHYCGGGSNDMYRIQVWLLVIHEFTSYVLVPRGSWRVWVEWAPLQCLGSYAHAFISF